MHQHPWTAHTLPASLRAASRLTPRKQISLAAVLLLAAASAIAESDNAADHAPLDTIPVVAKPDSVPPAPEESAPTPLDDIYVTADKRKTPRRDVPASVDVLTGSELEDRGVNELRDFILAVPGVGFTELQADLFRVSIRGIDADVTAVTAATSGIFIDDIPFNDPFLNQVRPDLPPFDLDAIEILKGPQGTLFGGSGLAGAIRYRLADAEPGVFSMRAFGQYQDVNEGSPNWIGGGALNLPLGDDAALRLVGVQRTTGGVYDDLRSGATDTDEADSFSGRALLRWNPTDRLTLQLKALHQRTDADDLPRAENADGRLEREETIGLSPLRNEFDVYGLDLGYELPWATLVSATSVMRKYAESLNAGTERTLGIQQLGQPVSAPVTADVDGLVQEFRLVSNDAADARWQWLVGVYGHRYSGVSTQQVRLEPSLTGLNLPLLDLLAQALPALDGNLLGLGVNLIDYVADIDAQELAVFGEVSRKLGSYWTATLGLRGYRIETEGSTVGTGPLILAAGSLQSRNDADIESSGVNPRVALQFAPSDDAIAYASIARGFRFGGIQLVAPSALNPNVPPTYAPDSLWSYELGFRTRWLDQALHIDGAIFYIDWTDAQVRTTTGGAVALNVIDNVGGARSYGAELALRAQLPIEGLELLLAAAWTDAVTTTSFTSPTATVQEGARMPGVADTQLTIALDYRWFWGSCAFTATLAHTRLGEAVSDIEQSMSIYDFATTHARVSAAFVALPGRPKLSVGLTNLSDERGIVSAFFVGGDRFYTYYNRPRTLDVRIDLTF